MERIEELEPSELFVQVRDFVANRGLVECQKLLEQDEGPPGFYKGAITGFKECEQFSDLDALANRIDELRKLEEKRFVTQGPSPDKVQLTEWFYWRGYLCQLEFLWDRARLLGDWPITVSATAVVDLFERILPAISDVPYKPARGGGD